MTTSPESWSERLSALDAGFLDLEAPNAPMHVGSVSIFSGKVPSQREMADLIASRLDRVPRYAQKLASVPFGLGRPVWVDDPDFDLDRHVLATSLPRPGLPELRRFVADLLARPLDRDRPLWEYWLLGGLGRGRFAVVTKTHHCMIDGVSGVDLASTLMEIDRRARRTGPPVSLAPRPAPGAIERVKDALGDQLSRPFGLAFEAIRPDTLGRRALGEIAGGFGPLLGIGKLGPAPASSLNRTVGLSRRWEMVSLDLAEVKEVRGALGGTVNDVVLAVVAGGLRKLLLSRRETIGAPLRVLVPVSVRAPEERSALGNRVAALFCPLPVDEPDPLSRLRLVSAATKGLKESRQAVGAMALTRLGDFAPPTLAALATRLQAMAPWFNVVVTNVPGPQLPLYLLGRRLLACHPAVPLTVATTISVALLSYDGSIDLGLLGDGEQAADLAVLARAVRTSLAELVGLARATGGAGESRKSRDAREGGEAREAGDRSNSR